MKQRALGVHASIVTLLLWLPLTLGCAKPETSTATQPNAPTSPPSLREAPAGQATAGQATPRPQPLSLRAPATSAESARAQPNAPQSTPPPLTPATSAELLSVDRADPVPARDFRIGPLFVAAAKSDAPREAGELVARLLEGLVSGNLDAELFGERSRERLMRSLAYYSGRGSLPRRYRIGALHERAEGEVIANVRLFGEIGVTEGEIYVVRSESGWLVDDLQIGFAELERAYEPPEEPFVPSSFEYDRSARDGE